MTYIIIITIFVLLAILMLLPRKETFAIPIIDPYSLFLHADATRREEIWRLAHTKKLYYYTNAVEEKWKE